MSRTLFYWFWIAAIVALIAMHVLHPRADFPNHSPWMDYSKYTDEGWYGKAAIDHYITGSWYSPGDFNAAVALPVLPLLELAVFHFTGPSLVAARLLILAVFAANLLLVYLVIRARSPRWTALLAVTLLAANAFLYAFSRLAILESLLVFFLLASWALALRLPRKPATYAACGLAICLMILTKTTALFLLPSTFFVLWVSAAPGFFSGLAARVKAVVTAAAAAALSWSAYYLLRVRPHYLVDYRYLFTANQWGHPTSFREWCAVAWYTVHGILWISPTLGIVTVALLALSLMFFRSLWRNPLFIASFLALAGYLFFIAWHRNMQPRYYQVAAYPLAIILALAIERALNIASEGDVDSILHRPYAVRAGTALALGTAALALAISTASNARLMLHWVRHPEYSWVNAATNLTHYIDHHPGGNRLLLSISGDEITLATGLPAICDDFGTWDLDVRTRHYQPGWYAAWNELDPGTESDLETQYRLKQVATFPAFDDKDRNLLILYKLQPLQPVRHKAKRRWPDHTIRPSQVRATPVAQPSGVRED